MHDRSPNPLLIKAEAPCVGILLAAGFGRRFTAALAAAGIPADPTDKLSVRLPDGRTLAETSAQALLEATGCTLAVVRPDTPALHAQLRRAGAALLVSEDARRGMGASLAAAARHLIAHDDDAQTALIALADMPWISADTYRQVERAARQHAIVVPVYEGRRGHPVALHRSMWPALAQLDGDVGARGLLQNQAVHAIEVTDSGILRDVDLPGDVKASG